MKSLHMWCLYSVNLCNGKLKSPYETEKKKNKTEKKTKKQTKERKKKG